MSAKDRPFAGFISHSNVQREFASRLQHWLEFDFMVPESILADDGDAVQKLRPVFRDLTDLPAHENLREAIKENLSRAKVLIVVCSTEAANSKYVNEEVDYFTKCFPDRPVLGILAPGMAIGTEGVGPLLPASMKAGMTPLLANPDEEGEHLAFLRLASRMLGLSFGDLVDRHAKHEREIQRKRARLAAKTHTLPAEAAYLGGDVPSALKHALAACLDGDDFTWSQSPELEAVVREYMLRLPIGTRIFQLGKDNRRYKLRSASPLGQHLLIVGFANGVIQVVDRTSGGVLLAFDGYQIWDEFNDCYPESDSHEWRWFRLAWDSKQPLHRVATAPDGRRAIITHGQCATSWDLKDLRPTGLYLQEHYSLIRFHPHEPKALLASDQSQYYSRLTLAMLDTGDMQVSESKVWEPVDAVFTEFGGEQALFILTHDGEIIHLDPDTLSERSRFRIRNGRTPFGEFLENGSAVRLKHIPASKNEPLFFRRNVAGEWRSADQLDSALKSSSAVQAAQGGFALVFDIEWGKARLVRSASPTETLATLSGRSPSFSPDGSKLLLQGPDNDVVTFVDCEGESITPIILDGKGFRRSLPVCFFTVTTQPAWSAIWSPNGKLFVTQRERVSKTSDIEEIMSILSGSRLFETALDIHAGENGSIFKVVASRGDELQPLCFSNDSAGLWVIWNDCELRYVDLKEPRLSWLVGHDTEGDRLIVSPNGALIATNEDDRISHQGRVRLRDATTGDVLTLIEVPQPVAACEFLDADTLILPLEEGGVHVIRTSGARLHIHAEPELEFYPNILSCSKIGLYLIASLEDGPSRVIVRDGLSTKPPVFIGPECDLSSAAISEDGRWVVFADKDGEGMIVDLTEECGPREISLPFGHVHAIAFDLNAGTVWFSTAFGPVEAIKLLTGESCASLRPKLANQEYGIDHAVLAPGVNIAILSEIRMVQILDLGSGAPIVLHEPAGRGQSPAALSPDGTLVATGAQDAAIRLWRVRDGALLGTLRANVGYSEHIAFGPDGRYLFASHHGGGISRWDVWDAYLGGEELTEWIVERTKTASLPLDERDEANLLLREIHNQSQAYGNDMLKLFSNEAVRARGKRG